MLKIYGVMPSSSFTQEQPDFVFSWSRHFIGQRTKQDKKLFFLLHKGVSVQIESEQREIETEKRENECGREAERPPLKCGNTNPEYKLARNTLLSLSLSLSLSLHRSLSSFGTHWLSSSPSLEPIPDLFFELFSLSIESR